MAFNSFQYEVTTGRTQIPLPATGDVMDQVNWGIQVPSTAAAGVYLGGVNVATSGASSGWFVDKGQSFSGTVLRAADAPFVIGTAASVMITVLTNG